MNSNWCRQAKLLSTKLCGGEQPLIREFVVANWCSGGVTRAEAASTEAIAVASLDCISAVVLTPDHKK